MFWLIEIPDFARVIHVLLAVNAPKKGSIGYIVEDEKKV
jgi:hypothetical protein